MKSSIYFCNVWHSRTPQDGSGGYMFEYPNVYFAVDLDCFKSSKSTNGLFGHNAFGVFAIYDRDYLKDLDGPLGQRVRMKLGSRTEIARIVLLTSPRYFGYAFNPVSFFFCYDSNGLICALLVEVNNTFGETHDYILIPQTPSASAAGPFEFAKEFYVSPFFDVSGMYFLHVLCFTDQLDIKIDLSRGGSRVFSSKLSGRAESLTTNNMIRTMFRLPFSLWLTMLRIQAQALRIFFKHRIRMSPKPVKPPHQSTLVHAKRIHRIRLSAAELLDRLAGRRSAKLNSDGKP